MNSRAKQLIWVFFEKFGVVLISVFTFFIYAKLLGPKELGIALFVLSIGQGLAVFLFSLLEDPLVRHSDPTSAHFDSAFWAGLVTSFILVALIMVGCLLYTEDTRMRWLMFVSSLHIPVLTISRIYIADLRRKGQFKALAKRTLWGRVIGSAVGLALAWFGQGSWAIIAQSILMFGVSLAIMLVSSELVIGRQFSKPALKELLKVGWPLAVRGGSWDALNRGVTILLGVTAGATEVGIFGLARRMIDMPRSAIYGGLLSYALPAFSRNQDNLENLQKMFCFSTKTTCFVIFPMFVGLALVAPYLIPAIFGDEWEASVHLIQILAVVAAISNIMLYVPSALTAVARTQLTLGAEVFATIAALVLVSVLGGTYGGLAGALAMAAHGMLLFPAKMLGVNKAIAVSPRRLIGSVYKSLLACVLMSAVVTISLYFIGVENVVVAGVYAVIIGAITYLTSYTLLYRTWAKDLKVFLTK